MLALESKASLLNHKRNITLCIIAKELNKIVLVLKLKLIHEKKNRETGHYMLTVDAPQLAL